MSGTSKITDHDMAPPAAAVEAEGVQEAEFAFEDARAGPRQPEGQNNHVATVTVRFNYIIALFNVHNHNTQTRL